MIHFKYAFLTLAMIYLGVSLVGFTAWIAQEVSQPDPVIVRTTPNCAEYFYDHKKNFRWVPVENKPKGWVNFRDTDQECG